MNYLNGGPWRLVDEFTEVESGKRNARPELQKALAACRKHKGKLIIAKLDRLSRNLAFIATLMDTSSSSPPTTRTPTGSPSTSSPPSPSTSGQQSASVPRPPWPTSSAAASSSVVPASPQPARRPTKPVARPLMRSPIIKEIQASGVSSLRGVARALTARGVRTARGGDWTVVQVSDVLRR